MTRKKIWIDGIMYLLLLLCMGYQLTGGLGHEIIGVLLFVLFGIHLVLNGYWFRHFFRIAKHSVTSLRMLLSFLTDTALLLDMTVLAVTSVCISRNLFAWMKLPAGYQLKSLHIFCSYLGFIIISVHIGCHWKPVVNAVCKKLKTDGQRTCVTILFRTAAILIIVSGVIFSFRQNIGSRLTFSQGRGHENVGFEGDGLPQTDGNAPGNGAGKGLGGGHGKGAGKGTGDQGERGQAMRGSKAHGQETSGQETPEQEMRGPEAPGHAKNRSAGLPVAYIAITGMYIAVTYYVLELAERKRKTDFRHSSE